MINFLSLLPLRSKGFALQNAFPQPPPINRQGSSFTFSAKSKTAGGNALPMRQKKVRDYANP
jgi:hypothetical protein